mgnify:CR=1 FL=1
MQAESKKKILVVDDEESITSLLSAILKNNYILAIAHNSHDAILKTHEFQPDLITLDISMPGLKGDDLLPVFRAWKPHIPVWVISASNEPEIREKCFKKGASGFIPKPFERSYLLEQIETVLNGEVQPAQISEVILDEVELAMSILERKGLITEDEAKEEIKNVKSRLNN